MNQHRAFTMIELLTVIAIIAILAAIAVPNFLEAQIRSKISRTTADMAVLEGALRAYYADHNAYPPNHPLVRPFIEACLQVEDVSTKTVPTPAGAPIQWTRRRPPAPPSSPGGALPGGPPLGMEPQMMEMDPAMPAMGMGPRSAPPGPPGAPPRGSFPASYPPGYWEAAVPAGSEDLTSPVARMDLATTSPASLDQLSPETREAFGMTGSATGMNLFQGRLASPLSGYPVLDVSGDALRALTTPVAYFTSQLPLDPFSAIHTPFWYINYVEILGADHLMTDGGKARRYLILSFGPDQDQLEPTLANPMRGPFVSYDPTNGTVSQGDLVRFGY